MSLSTDQLASLVTEVTTDPKQLGLPALLADGNHQGIADRLNARTGAGVEPVDLATLSRDDFLLGIAPALLVLPNLTADVQAKWDRILAVVAAAGSIRVGSETVRALLAAAVADGLMDEPTVAALTTRPGSRAEKVFGVNAVVTAADVANAFPAPPQEIPETPPPAEG